MASTSKTISSPGSDDHLMKKRKLAEDAEKQARSHTNKIRERKNLPPNDPMRLPLDPEDPAVKELTELDPVSKAFEDGDQLGIENGEQIVGIRLFDRDPAGLPIGRDATGEEGTATHSRVRRERHHYYDTDRTKVEVGKVIRLRKSRTKETRNEDEDDAIPEPKRDYEDEDVDPDGYVHEPRRKRKTMYKDTRTDLERKASGVLRTIMVRLMPHEAQIAGRWNMSKHALAKAIDQTVNIFAKAVGCDVISAVVHRMREKDLHIHIQYTMIIPQLESPSALGRRRLREWKEIAKEKAYAALATEGRADAGPRTVGKKKNDLIASGELPPRPVREIEYRKHAGRRSLEEDHLLGYSLRQKLNLVRLAEDGAMPDLAIQVMKKRDKMNKFRRLAMRRDTNIEDHYMDVWLERTWRRAVKANLSEEAVKEMAAAGIGAAKDYVTYGTVMVEETHLDRRKDALDARQAELDALAKELEKNRDAAVLARERAETAAKVEAAPIIEEAMKRQKAVESQEAGLELSALHRARQRIAGPGAPVSAATTVSEMEKEIDQILEFKVKAKVQSGLVNALKQVFARILPGKPLPQMATAQALEQSLVAGISEEKNGAVMSAWKSVFAFFVPKGEAPKGATVEELAPEVQSAARKEAFRMALAEIKGVKVSEIADLDEASLRAEIQNETAVVRRGLGAAIKELFEGVTGSSLTKMVTNPMAAVKERFKSLSRTEKYSRTFVKNMEPLIGNLPQTLWKSYDDLKDSLPEEPEVIPTPAETGKPDIAKAGDKPAVKKKPRDPDR